MKKHSYIVTVRRESMVEIVTNECTEEDIRNGNYEPEEETEVDVIEDRVLSWKVNS